jgi:NAD(P)-dependent dehydrogenase (short-subunit alcohol dehydrogenase family)
MEKRAEIAIVTGANGAIGAAISEQLVVRGWQVIMACRRPDKGEEIRAAIVHKLSEGGAHSAVQERLSVMPLDLLSCHSIEAFVAALQGEGVVPTHLVNNAGVMTAGYRQHQPSGLETDMAINFAGTAYLSEKIADMMAVNGGVRIVNTVSVCWRIGSLNRVWGERNYLRLLAYADSKLALYIYTAHMVEQFKGRNATVNAADPGVVDSDMLLMGRWFDCLTKVLFCPLVHTPLQGAEAALAAATAETGGYTFYSANKRGPFPQRVKDHPLLARVLQMKDAFIG